MGPFPGLTPNLRIWKVAGTVCPDGLRKRLCRSVLSRAGRRSTTGSSCPTSIRLSESGLALWPVLFELNAGVDAHLRGRGRMAGPKVVESMVKESFIQASTTGNARAVYRANPLRRRDVPQRVPIGPLSDGNVERPLTAA